MRIKAIPGKVASVTRAVVPDAGIMYLQHYNLSQIPFRNTPDPRFFYETPRHNEALANLIYAVEQRRGFVLLSGEIGSGKTLVTHMLLRHLEDHAQIALVRNTHLNSSAADSHFVR